ncbi:MAG: thioredoxin [Eubacterium sp.]|nr:thioredoxin [Eubacterium sp.]
MMAVITLTKENYESEVLQSDKPVLIDFWAGWCGPCQMLSPIVDAVAEERDDIKVAKLNVDQEDMQEIVMQFRVMSIPMLVVIKDGEETNRSVGVISKEEILALL